MAGPCACVSQSLIKISSGIAEARGDSRGIRGDSRGTRWGPAGDLLTFWGTRAVNVCSWFEFQGDPFETTSVFYNIKRGQGGGMKGF